MTLEICPGIALELVSIQPGKFVMGSNEHRGEGPATEGEIRKSFWISRHQITREQWFCLTTRFPADFRDPALQELKRNSPRQNLPIAMPMDGVMWRDAGAYCQRLRRITRRKFRLPTESEWEYAYRGGTQTEYPFSERAIREQSDLPSDFLKTLIGVRMVSRQQANSFGLYGVYESLTDWCQDRWHSSHVGRPRDGSAWLEPERGLFRNARVMRGGGWGGVLASRRASWRGSDPELGIPGQAGFRVVLDGE